ncbi:MAG: hypothetical protein LAO06_15465 [Acidobacteriia bacterium]|nr:hypothetical protein [Terriglobia bacterium]
MHSEGEQQMAKDVSVILQSLLARVKKRGYSDDEILRVAAQGDTLLDKFADVMAEAARKPRDVFPVTVNYDLSLEEAIKAGEYQAVHTEITAANFPSTRIGQADVEIVLIRFDRRMASEDVVRELDREGLRAAELPEFLAFGAAYPDVQRKFSVAGLGSVWRDRKGYRNVPCLYEASEGRYLDLHWWDDGWYTYTRFAATHK